MQVIEKSAKVLFGIPNERYKLKKENNIFRNSLEVMDNDPESKIKILTVQVQF